VVRPNGGRGVAPLAVAAVGAGGLAVVLAAFAPDAALPDANAVAQDDPIPAAQPDVVPGSTGEPKRPEVTPPPLQASPRPGGGVIVQAAPGAGKVEAPILSTIDPTRPPPLPRSLDATSPVPGLNPPFGAEPRRVETDATRVKSPLRAGPAEGHRGGASPAADRAALDRVAAYAAERAIPLAVPIEAALPPRTADGDAAGRVRASVPWTPPLVVREYAAPRPGAGETVTGDTVLWQPLIVLPTDGKTTLTFSLGDAPGGYQVVVAGHTLDGRIGTVRTVLPAPPK
jgi:hypothetical protein